MSDQKICRTKDCGRKATARFPVLGGGDFWWSFCDCCLSAYNAGRKHKTDEEPHEIRAVAEYIPPSTERIEIIEQALEVFSLMPETDPVRAELLKRCAQALIVALSPVAFMTPDEIRVQMTEGETIVNPKAAEKIKIKPSGIKGFAIRDESKRAWFFSEYKPISLTEEVKPATLVIL